MAREPDARGPAGAGHRRSRRPGAPTAAASTHDRPGAGDPAPVRRQRASTAPGRPLAAEVVDRYLAPGPAPARRRDRAPVRDGDGRVRPGAAGARARGRGRQRGPRARGGAARASPTGGRSRSPTPAPSRGPRWTGSTPTGSPAASCSRLLGDPPRPWVGTRSARRRSSTRWTRRGPRSRPARSWSGSTSRPAASWPTARPARGAGRAVAGVQPSSRGGLDAYDPSGQPIPTGAQRALVGPAPVRRRGGRAPSRVCPAHDRRPGARRAGPGGRRRVRADRPRRSRTRCARSSPAAWTRTARSRTTCSRTGCSRGPGTRVLVPAGPLLVAPRPRRRRALRTRRRAPAGRSRCSCSRSRSPAATGSPPSRSSSARCPDWLVDEPDSPARAAAEIALRRALLPGHPLAFIEPAAERRASARVAGGRQRAAARRRRRRGDRPPARRIGRGHRRRAAWPSVAASLRASRDPARADAASRLDACDAAGRRGDATLAALEDRGWQRAGRPALGIRRGASAPRRSPSGPRRSTRCRRGAPGPRLRLQAGQLVGLVLVVDQAPAGGAVPARPRAACRTPRGGAARPTPPRRDAPVGEQAERARELAAVGASARTPSAAGAAEYGVATRIPARSRRRSRSDRMFGAIPGTASPSSLNRRGAGEQRLDEQQAPAVADAVERGPERARGRLRGRGRRRRRGTGGHRVHGRGGLAGRHRR